MKKSHGYCDIKQRCHELAEQCTDLEDIINDARDAANAILESHMVGRPIHPDKVTAIVRILNRKVRHGSMYMLNKENT